MRLLTGLLTFVALMLALPVFLVAAGAALGSFELVGLLVVSAGAGIAVAWWPRRRRDARSRALRVPPTMTG